MLRLSLLPNGEDGGVGTKEWEVFYNRTSYAKCSGDEVEAIVDDESGAGLHA